MDTQGISKMTRKRHNYTKNVKTEIAIAAIKEKVTQAQLASKYGVHPSKIKDWKQHALTAIGDSFISKPKHSQSSESMLYEQIGRLSVENDFLKKKLNK